MDYYSAHVMTHDTFGSEIVRRGLLEAVQSWAELRSDDHFVYVVLTDTPTPRMPQRSVVYQHEVACVRSTGMVLSSKLPWLPLKRSEHGTGLVRMIACAEPRRS